MRTPPPTPTPRFQQSCASRLDEFDALVRGICAWSQRAGVPQAVMKDVVLILDELFSNIVIHGYLRHPDGEIRVEAEATANQVNVTLMDHAHPFNPLLVPEPDTTLPLEERPIGGLGLLFVRRTADDLQYALAPEGMRSITNWLRFTKRYDRSGRP